jgi:hypothetical protein
LDRATDGPRVRLKCSPAHDLLGLSGRAERTTQTRRKHAAAGRGAARTPGVPQRLERTCRRARCRRAPRGARCEKQGLAGGLAGWLLLPCCRVVTQYVHPQMDIIKLYYCRFDGLSVCGQLVRGTKPLKRSGHGLAVVQDLSVIFGGDVQGSTLLSGNPRRVMLSAYMPAWQTEAGPATDIMLVTISRPCKGRARAQFKHENVDRADGSAGGTATITQVKDGLCAGT